MLLIFILLFGFVIFLFTVVIKGVLNANPEEQKKSEKVVSENFKFSDEIKKIFKKYRDFRKHKILYTALLVAFIFTNAAIYISTTNGYYKSSYVYQELSENTVEKEIVPAVEGKDAVYEEVKTYTTYRSGEYVIGLPPALYSTGDETSFTTSQSGTYIAGTDFPAGTYDIEAVSGSGNVQGTNLNEIMGVASENSSYMTYINTYDNHTFEVGDTLITRSVAVELVPQNEDTFVIEEGVYNLVAIEGGGNVQGSGLNEIMGTAAENTYGNYVPNYDNATMEFGKILKVSDVAVQLTSKDKPKIISEAVIAKPETTIDITYKMNYNQVTEEHSCTKNFTTVDCESIPSYEIMKAKIESRKGNIIKTDGNTNQENIFHESVYYDDLSNEYSCELKRDEKQYEKIACDEIKSKELKIHLNAFELKNFKEI
jgi:hypothetical protein